MIVEISNSITEQYGKKNWIDQNLVVFGYYDSVHCCEEWGWGVYDPETKEKVADSPNGMPYHFDFSIGVDKQEFYDFSDNDNRLVCKDEFVDTLDCVRVSLLPDEGIEGKPLVFEAYTKHNGYYLHSFSFSNKSSCAHHLF